MINDTNAIKTPIIIPELCFGLKPYRQEQRLS